MFRARHAPGQRYTVNQCLPGERDNARNSARCTQARKTIHGLDGQHQDMQYSVLTNTLGPWAPPAERGPSLESFYRVSLTVGLFEGNKIISFKNFISPQPVKGPSNRKKNPRAQCTCPVCPLVKTALHQDVDRSPRVWKSQSEWQRTEINEESTSTVWPALGSRTGKEQNQGRIKR